MKRVVLSIASLLIISQASMGQVKEVTGKSSLSHVTLYRTQAMVSRAVVIGDETGELAVLVEDLPATINPGSLFATSDELDIRSVRYFTEYITTDDNKDKSNELDRQLKEIQNSLNEIQPKRELLKTKKAFIGQLESRYLAELGPSATALTKDTLAQSGFDFKTIQEMTTFIFTQQQALTLTQLELDGLERDLKEKTEQVNEKMRALRHGSSTANAPNQQAVQMSQPAKKMLRKAMVYVAKKKKGSATLRLNYLVNGASWNPTYNMRISNKNSTQLNVEYLAHVNQLTGEDWGSVELTLSTATPNMNADIPMLAPMWVRLVSTDAAPRTAVISGKNLLVANQDAQMSLNTKFQQVKQGGQEYKDYNYQINDVAFFRQNLEFDNGREVLRKWYADARKSGTGIAVEYKIPDTITLASRRDNQMVQILSADIKSKMYYEAVPLLSDYVSRGIEAKNMLNQPLLAGRYSAFIDNQYVGSGNLPLTVTGQTLDLGFGSVPQLKCSRELLDKTGNKSWGSRTETYVYKFTLDNYKSVPAEIRLLDRIPVTKDEGLKITLKKGKEALSKDEEYREFELPKGILRWDMMLPESSSGFKATTFEYSYDVKFDSDMKISTQGEKLRRQVEEDLMDFQLRRRK